MILYQSGEKKQLRNIEKYNKNLDLYCSRAVLYPSGKNFQKTFCIFDRTADDTESGSCIFRFPGA